MTGRRAHGPRGSTLVLAGALVFFLASCGDGGAAEEDEREAERGTSPSGGLASASSTPPPVEGAVLSVGSVPILREQLEALTDAAGRVSPEFSRDHLRRIVLESVLVPRAALHAAFTGERERARARALAARATLEAGEPLAEGLATRTLEADVRHLGLVLWAELSASPRGRWVGPLEDIGAWCVARRLASEAGAKPGLTKLTLELVELSFLPGEEPRPFVDAALAAAELRVHDPVVGELVPESLRWRMHRP